MPKPGTPTQPRCRRHKVRGCPVCGQRKSKPKKPAQPASGWYAKFTPN